MQTIQCRLRRNESKRGSTSIASKTCPLHLLQKMLATRSWEPWLSLIDQDLGYEIGKYSYRIQNVDMKYKNRNMDANTNCKFHINCKEDCFLENTMKVEYITSAPCISFLFPNCKFLPFLNPFGFEMTISYFNLSHNLVSIHDRVFPINDIWVD